MSEVAQLVRSNVAHLKTPNLISSIAFESGSSILKDALAGKIELPQPNTKAVRERLPTLGKFVGDNMEDITALKTRGMTWQHIADLLKTAGINTSGNSLQKAVNEERRRAGKTNQASAFANAKDLSNYRHLPYDIFPPNGIIEVVHVDLGKGIGQGVTVQDENGDLYKINIPLSYRVYSASRVDSLKGTRYRVLLRGEVRPGQHRLKLVA